MRGSLSKLSGKEVNCPSYLNFCCLNWNMRKLSMLYFNKKTQTWLSWLLKICEKFIKVSSLMTNTLDCHRKLGWQFTDTLANKVDKRMFWNFFTWFLRHREVFCRSLKNFWPILKKMITGAQISKQIKKHSIFKKEKVSTVGCPIWK